MNATTSSPDELVGWAMKLLYSANVPDEPHMNDQLSDALADLASSADLRAELDRLDELNAAIAHQNRGTWQEVGDALGITYGAARHRYGDSPSDVAKRQAPKKPDRRGGISLVEAAEKIGVSAPTVHLWIKIASLNAMRDNVVIDGHRRNGDAVHFRAIRFPYGIKRWQWRIFDIQ